MQITSRKRLRPIVWFVLAGVGLAAVFIPGFFASRKNDLNYRPRQSLETSGLPLIVQSVAPWPATSLESISSLWQVAGSKLMKATEQQLGRANLPEAKEVNLCIGKAMIHCFHGEPIPAYETLTKLRAKVEAKEHLAVEWLYTIIYFQGVAALRRGEDENCIQCRGESSCILPIAPAAVHTNTTGSTLAVKHCTEYLDKFPDDWEVRWLLNLAHMTLGEHPHKVDPRFVISLDKFTRSEFDIGKFRDVGHLVGVNRLNHGGGAIMEDFDNDGLLDIVITSFDHSTPMALYRNKGDGTFADGTKQAGLSQQLGGLYCVQTDYNNDGHMDITILRGAWMPHPIRPSLLRNNGDGTFTDVTAEAGLLAPVNSISASWADYDNDGFLDLFVCCELQPNRLYHNEGNGTFKEVAAAAGVQAAGIAGKGAAWLDYDNDGYADLFVDNFLGTAELFHNERDGTFTNVTKAMGIQGPEIGFSCWAFDYDNDGWLDIFATSYDRSVEDVIKGLLDLPHSRKSNKLYRNLEGKGFQDVTAKVGLDKVFATMGCNFGDFDNDGYLDFYLGTGDSNLATLVPNRMFKNVAGQRFAEISGTSGTGHLQKGHGVACGDWDNDGTVDIFIEMGGAINGDKYHNVLFQNPGHGNSYLTVKLVGKKANRAAIGARIKVVTAGGAAPLTVHRHVSSGSSFGASPLQQTIGLGKASRVALLEISWPASGTTQVFRDIAVNQAIEVTEFAAEYKKLNRKKLKLPT